MDALAVAYKHRMTAIEISECCITVSLDDGRKVSMPLSWFPFLQNASPEQLANYELSDTSVFWEDLDDGISMEPVILGLP